MQDFSTRDLIVETVNKLFVFTDQQQWQRLREDVLTDKVDFDMSSLGGAREILSAQTICDTWENGFKGIDAVNHLAGNYLVTIDGDKAQVFAYATATHFKKAAINGQVREFVGTYQIGLQQLPQGWRINAFQYTLKYLAGNADLS
ncbi:nuclear transport factor 2 family protein [Flavihumibacter petaseus]|uniref:SnoaL-like domain-containing protein n=1 Tax=Flavihumibacter petaseus NBRC 106054 TaxID=1220578 RepID=A0A0E9N5B1_9BACT|nr:nuclear transport factor 2 family protein [Flavihumibacter petaseus]GAO44866.1 hypothetical protein FPE01S_04_01090 [Flavihumibacter petaseus NBRC 106054]